MKGLPFDFRKSGSTAWHQFLPTHSLSCLECVEGEWRFLFENARCTHRSETRPDILPTYAAASRSPQPGYLSPKFWPSLTVEEKSNSGHCLLWEESCPISGTNQVYPYYQNKQLGILQHIPSLQNQNTTRTPKAALPLVITQINV